MIAKGKTRCDFYPYAYDRIGTEGIHPAFMFEQLSMEDETPRRARSRSTRHFGLGLQSLSACSRRRQSRALGMRLDVVRLNGRRENFLVTTCDAASLVARLYKTQIAGPYARRHAVWRVRCNRMR